MRGAAVRALIVLAATSVMATALALDLRFDPEKMMRASEIKRGMEGYALTVFHGTEPTKFGIRILGVLPQALSGRPYIIFRVTDGPLLERDAPVMGGMSGSPAFINGKLIGAIAYTYPYEKEPCGGITGIEAMIEGVTGKPITQAYVPQPVSIGSRHYTRVALAGVDHQSPEALPLRPIASPVYFSSGTARVNQWQRSLLSLLGFDGVPGASAHPPLRVELQPGSGLGVELARGDFLMYTFGTVTWREGDAVIGFGHPFLGKDDIRLPLTSVYIHDFVSSYRRSDKEGVIMDRLGVISSDNPWAIGGTVGETAESVPGVYRIVDETKDREHTFTVQMARDRLLTPSICLGTLFSSMDALYYGWGKPGIARIQYSIRGSQGAVLQRSDVYYHSGDPIVPLGEELSSALRLFTDNRFEPQDVTQVSAQVHLRAEQRVARIERVYTDQQAAVAGKQLTVHVLLKPVDEPVVEKTVTFDLPWELPKAGVYLGVAGGEAGHLLRRELGGFTPEFHTLERVLRYLESLEPNDQLLVMLALPRQGIAVEDTPLPGLPQTYASRLSAANRSGIRAIRDYEIKTLQMPWVVEGRYTTALPTITRTGERGKPAPPKQTEEAHARRCGKIAQMVNSVATGSVPQLEWRNDGVFALPMKLANEQEKEEEEKEDNAAPSEETPKAEEEKKPPSGQVEKEGKPGPDKGKVVAKVSQWSLCKYEELAKGELEGLAVHCKGWLVPGMRWEKPVALPEPLVWDIAAVEGRCYIAAGLDGKLYLMRGGAIEEFFQVPEGLFITSVATLSDGTIACAAVPKARLYLLEPDGKLRKQIDLQEHYVWDLLSQGTNLLVGTGRPGRVYQVNKQGEVQLVSVVPEEHVTALAVAGGQVYAATAERGGVYRVGPGRAEHLIAWTDFEPRGLACLNDGTVVVGLANKASIVTLRPNGRVETWYQDQDAVLNSLVSLGDAVVAATGAPAALIRARGSQDWELVAREPATEMYSALCADEQGRVWVAGSFPGQVAAQQSQPAELAYLSPAYDAKGPARWLQMLADFLPEDAAFSFYTRTGPSPYYDSGTWSAWSTVTHIGPAYDVASPAGQYAQLRVVVPPSVDATLRSLIVSYRLQNRPPVLKVSAPQVGAALSQEAEVRWEVTDPDEDTVQVEIAVQRHGESVWQDVAKRQTEGTYKWNTKNLQDGVYRLRVTASDLPSRPEECATEHVYISPIIVDNTAPALQIGSGPRRHKDGETECELLASDALSGVASVAWQYPQSEVWYALAPQDGVYGGRFETCRLILPAEISGGTQITVRVRDLAGNHSDLTVSVPEPPKEVK